MNFSSPGIASLFDEYYEKKCVVKLLINYKN